MADAAPFRAPDGATGVLVLASGDVVWGRGFGAEGEAVGEVCFHTAMTGYQEIMTDPSFAGQIITFTFPHIGNVGANPDDVEADRPHALAMIVREDVTAPSSFRSVERLDGWMKRHARIGLAGVDTRALTRRIRAGGAPNGVVAHSASGVFDVPLLLEMARAWPGLEGMDLAREVSTATHYGWEGGVWRLGFGYGESPSRLREGLGEGMSASNAASDMPSPDPSRKREGSARGERPHVVAVDYGSKHNIFRNLALAGARVSVVPATASFDEIEALRPDGYFLSNGPGDPAATAEYAAPVIRAMLDTGKPLFGICLGHQLLALAVGARTTKMFQGHRGANHPVKRLSDGAVEITSMNHGFAVERESLPAGVTETHVSLFDGSNAGLELDGGRAFSVQHHPEASPGPQDSIYLFQRFADMLHRAEAAVAPAPRRFRKIVRDPAVIAHFEKMKKEVSAAKLAALAERRAKSVVLAAGNDLDRGFLIQLLRSCVWWNTHSSGKPIRAPNFAYRASMSPLGLELEFGANHFLVERFVREVRPILKQSVEAILNGFKVEQSSVRDRLMASGAASVANANLDTYAAYPVINQQLVFGAHSISLWNASNFLLRDTGLSDFFS